MIIVPVRDNLHYIEKVIHVLKKEYELNVSDDVVEYIKEYTYVFLDNDNVNKIIGIFSLSRIDSITSTSIFKRYISYIASIIYGRFFIYDVLIIKEKRRKGNGRLMLDMISDYCALHYPLIRMLELHTEDPNLHSFYSKCGYQLTHSIDKYRIYSKKII